MAEPGWDPQAAHGHLLRCPRMAPLAERVGMLPAPAPAENLFDDLVRSIVCQQISGKAAASILRRFEALTPEEKFVPESVLTLRFGDLRAAGLSTRKAEYVLDLARCAVEGRVNFEAMPHASDEEVVASLISVRGIGRWTAEMLLMFGLSRPDVFPLGDGGIRSAMARNFGPVEGKESDWMLSIADTWRPYRTAACMVLWRSLDAPNPLVDSAANPS